MSNYSYYDLLEISPNASDEVIKAAFKAMAKKYHPDVYAGDKAEAESIMKEINMAYETLSDSDLREEYDETFVEEESATSLPFKSDAGIAKEKGGSNNPTSQSGERPKSNIGSKIGSFIGELLSLLIVAAVIFAAYAIYKPLGALILFASGMAATSEKRFLRVLFVCVFAYFLFKSAMFEPVKDYFRNITSTSISEQAPSSVDASPDVSSQPTDERADYIAMKYLSNQYNFAAEHNIELNSFSEQKALSKWLYSINAEEINIEPVFLKTDQLWGAARFKKTDRQDEYAYFGQLKDNRPNGYGLLMKTYGSGAVMIHYIGSFKEGHYHGYGLMFNGSEELIYSISGSTGWAYGSQELQEFSSTWINHVKYEGKFKKGAMTGKGNYFENNLEMMFAAPFYESNGNSKDSVYYYLIQTGDFEDGALNGKGKIYYNGYLLYSGGFMDDECSGKGKIYYPESTQVKYEGNFSDSVFSGSGTSYYEDGTVEYQGKWVDGRPA